MTVGVPSWQRDARSAVPGITEIPAGRCIFAEERALLCSARMLRSSFSSSAALALAVVLAASAAPAQVFTNVVRSGSPRTSDPGSVTTTLTPTSPIGLRDCAGEVWSFTVNFSAGVSGTLASSLSYYIGIDAMSCASSSTRYPVTTGTAQCWPINQSPSLTFTNPTTPLSYTVRIESRWLVDPVAGNCAAPGTTQGTSGTNYLALLAFPPSDNNVIGTYTVTYDGTPPQAPANVIAAPAENSLVVTWNYATSISSDPDAATTSSSVPSDLQGFWLLCDPPGGLAPTDGGTGDGGTVDAAASGDDPTDTGCGASALASATFDPNDSAAFARYRCSDLMGPTATRGIAQGLTNGQSYQVAVVAQDLAGNRSTVALASRCVTPVPVTDFWESYRASGGVATPGACTVRRGRAGSGGGAAAVVLAAAALWIRRRRSR